MKSGAIIVNIKYSYKLELLVASSCVFSHKDYRKEDSLYIPVHFSRLYSNFPNLTHNDESLIRRAMVPAKLFLARNRT